MKKITWSNQCDILIGDCHCELCDFCKKDCESIIDKRDLKEPIYIITCSEFDCQDEWKNRKFEIRNRKEENE